MEAIQIGNNEDVTSANTDEMWQLLVTTITPFSIKEGKKDYCELKKILEMMNHALIFEDPGIFQLKFLSETEQNDHEFRYLWLLNKLLLITLNDTRKM